MTLPEDIRTLLQKRTAFLEREEMMKIQNIIEQLVQMHIKSLKDLGVDLNKEKKPAKLDDKLR